MGSSSDSPSEELEEEDDEEIRIGDWGGFSTCPFVVGRGVGRAGAVDGGFDMTCGALGMTGRGIGVSENLGLGWTPREEGGSDDWGVSD